jgi:hypothetical protein
MRLAAGEHDDLPGLEGDSASADCGGKAPAARDDVIGNQMIGAGQDLWQDLLACRRAEGPRRLGCDLKEDRAGQANGF